MHAVRDFFAEESYNAFKQQGGEGIFMRISDRDEDLNVLKDAFKTAVENMRIDDGKMDLAKIKEKIIDVDTPKLVTTLQTVDLTDYVKTDEGKVIIAWHNNMSSEKL
jgi:hypothetical protein